MSNLPSKSSLSNRRWLLIFSAILLTLTACFCTASYSLDLFGIFQDAHGHSLSVYNNERTAKYLLNKHYVPENFDALIIGSSSTANWQLGNVAGLHIYNESLDGGNASEARLLVEQALPTGHFKVAICLVHPYMLHNHMLNEGGTGTPSLRQAWLSVNILREEFNYTTVHYLGAYQKFHPDGSKTLETKPGMISRFPVKQLETDPVAISDYQALLSELRARGTYIVLIVPPLYQPLLEQDFNAIDTFNRTMVNALPHDALINLDSDSYRDFRSDPSNYDDGIHLNRTGAQRLGPLLTNDLNASLPESAQANIKTASKE